MKMKVYKCKCEICGNSLTSPIYNNLIFKIGKLGGMYKKDGEKSKCPFCRQNDCLKINREKL